MQGRLLLAFLFCALVPLRAQVSYDTLRWWNLAKYEAETLSNLAADTKNWNPMYKNGTLQRYANKVETDGLPLKANGVIIAETEGLVIGAGIKPGICC